VSAPAAALVAPVPLVAPRPATSDSPVARAALIAIALLFLGGVLFLPVAVVLVEAFADGLPAYVAAIASPEARSALSLTLLVTAIAVPANVVFGVALAYALARFDVRSKSLWLTLVDLPFSISPVVSGMLIVLLFGSRGLFGPWLAAHDVDVLFAVPGIVLATAFVTSPYVARELVPYMDAQGSDEEQAALVLGASGITTFLRVTLPKAKWGLLYGVVLCNARAMGEFGAVSVVSGHIRGKTNTLPLAVEVLYNEYRTSEAFAVASLLVLVAVATLVAKRALGRKAAAR
jgi:sulfate transport system permease protein